MKKIFLTAALFLTVAGMSVPATAQNEENVTIVNVEVVGADETPDGVPAGDILADATPSEEVNYIQESTIAKKMTQAEKAHNAAVNDSWGGAITIIAMCIVIAALAVLSVLFLFFGKVSQALLLRNKRATKPVAAAAASAAPEENHDIDSGEVIAAIAMALSEHFAEGHDLEETILTIRKLQKAYSPWSSKIYNLRTMPDHRRNTPGKATL